MSLISCTDLSTFNNSSYLAFTFERASWASRVSATIWKRDNIRYFLSINIKMVFLCSSFTAKIYFTCDLCLDIVLTWLCTGWKFNNFCPQMQCLHYCTVCCNTAAKTAVPSKHLIHYMSMVVFWVVTLCEVSLEDAESMFLWNAGTHLQVHMVSQLRRPPSTIFTAARTSNLSGHTIGRGSYPCCVNKVNSADLFKKIISIQDWLCVVRPDITSIECLLHLMLRNLIVWKCNTLFIISWSVKFLSDKLWISFTVSL